MSFLQPYGPKQLRKKLFFVGKTLLFVGKLSFCVGICRDFVRSKTIHLSSYLSFGEFKRDFQQTTAVQNGSQKDKPSWN